MVRALPLGLALAAIPHPAWACLYVVSIGLTHPEDQGTIPSNGAVSFEAVNVAPEDVKVHVVRADSSSVALSVQTEGNAVGIASIDELSLPGGVRIDVVLSYRQVRRELRLRVVPPVRFAQPSAPTILDSEASRGIVIPCGIPGWVLSVDSEPPPDAVALAIQMDGEVISASMIYDDGMRPVRVRAFTGRRETCFGLIAINAVGERSLVQRAPACDDPIPEPDMGAGLDLNFPIDMGSMDGGSMEPPDLGMRPDQGPLPDLGPEFPPDVGPQSDPRASSGLQAAEPGCSSTGFGRGGPALLLLLAMAIGLVRRTGHVQPPS